MSDRIEGLRLTGDFVKTLKDKNFTVMKIGMETFKDSRTGDEVRKYKYTVRLFDGAIRTFIPCQKCLQQIADKLGDLISGQVGKKLTFTTADKDVFGNIQPVIYIG